MWKTFCLFQTMWTESFLMFGVIHFPFAPSHFASLMPSANGSRCGAFWISSSKSISTNFFWHPGCSPDKEAPLWFCQLERVRCSTSGLRRLSGHPAGEAHYEAAGGSGDHRHGSQTWKWLWVEIAMRHCVSECWDGCWGPSVPNSHCLFVVVLREDLLCIHGRQALECNS